MQISNINLLDINVSDLEHWADYSEAEDELPEIIKKLVFLSGGKISDLRFLSREDGNSPGWDGVVVNAQSHPYIPQGNSYWEIGTNKKAKEKATCDYKKRTKATSSSIRKQSTFVFVTPRPWRNKNQWIKDVKDAKQWKDVKVLDRNDIVSWLNQHNILKIAFLQKYLKRNVTGVYQLEEKWNLWSKTTSPELPACLFNVEIAKNKDKFKTWLGSVPKRSYVVSADSELEGIAFVKCLLDEPDFAPERIKSIGFEQEAPIASFLSGHPEYIPVVTSPELADKCHAKESSHVIQICTKGMPSQETDISLGLVDYNSIRLFSAKSKGQNIESLASICGYSRVIIRQELKKSKSRVAGKKLDEYSLILTPLAFLGYIPINHESLQKAILHMSNAPVETFSTYLRRFKSILEEDETPVWMVHYPGGNSIIGCHSSKQVLHNVADSLDTAFVERLHNLIDEIFFKNPDNYSAHTRKCILEALTICSVHGRDWNLPAYDKLAFISQVLTNNALNLYGISSKSEHLKYLLPFFAELCPDLFMKKIQEADSFSKYADSSLEEALHILGHNSQYFRQIIPLLGYWYNLSNNRNQKDRITKIGQDFMQCMDPQFSTCTQERIEATKKLSSIAPDLCWAICIDQFHSEGLSIPVYSTARFRIAASDSPRRITLEDVYRFQDFAFKCIIESIANDFQRTIQVLKLIPYIYFENHKHIWKHIESCFSSFIREEQGELCYVFSGVIRDLGRFKHPSSAIKNAVSCYKKITSSNPFLAKIRFFYHGVTYFYPAHFLASRKKSILHECMQNTINIFDYTPRIRGIDYCALGESISDFSQFDFKKFVLDNLPGNRIESKRVRDFIYGYTLHWDETTKVNFIRKMLTLLPNDKLKAQIALSFPLSARICNLLTESGKELAEDFWHQHRGFTIDKFTNEAIILLSSALDNGRSDLAIEAIENSYEQAPPSLVNKILKSYSKQVWNDGINASLYKLSDILSYQYQNGSISLLQCALIEYRMRYHITSNREYLYPYTSQYLALHPNRFAQISDYVSNNMDNIFLDTIRRRHLSVWIYLVDHISIPTYCNNMSSWSEQVYAYPHKDVDFLNRRIGAALAAGNVFTINKWLTQDIRICIETFYNISLVEGFCMALTNKRGVLSRPIDAGGLNEHFQINILNKVIEDIACYYPCTHKTLNAYIQDLSHFAQIEDSDAITNKH